MAPSSGHRREFEEDVVEVELAPAARAESGTKRRRWGRRIGITAAIAVALVVLPAVASWAVDPSIDIGGKLKSANTALGLNNLWIIIGAVLVIFMQAGFALVETGFCRAKHAAHVVMTNFAIFGIGFVAFFLVGFGLSGLAYSVPVVAFFLYMVAFMDTTATIPTGSMAERWKWKAFVGWGLFCGALYYPIFGGWTWGGGWLSQLGNNWDLGFGYTDFAGSGVVHAMGGIAALAGAVVLGSRIGKYGPDGKPRTLAAHSIPMALLGTFILLFGWFGFNAASTLAATDLRFTVVATNTAIAAAFGATIGMFYVMWRMGKPDPGMMANGMLAGLVAITAPCAFVQPWAAAVIGSIAALVVIEAIFFFERRGIDDPVGAISVHGVGGIFGVLCVGIFSDGRYGAAWNVTNTASTKGHGVTGFLYDTSLGFKQLAAQAIGALVIIFVMGGIVYLFFKIQNAMMKGGIRSEAAHEEAGLDLPEMGVLAYDNLQLRELDVVGIDEDLVLSGGPSQDPSIGR